MKKTLKKLLTLALCAALAFSVCVPALAEDSTPTVTFNEKEDGGGFTFANALVSGNAYPGSKNSGGTVDFSSSTSLFDAEEFTNLFPGDTVDSKFTVATDSGNSSSYYIYMYARSIEDGSTLGNYSDKFFEEMLQYITITVTNEGERADGGDSWLYKLWYGMLSTLGFEAPADEVDQNELRQTDDNGKSLVCDAAPAANTVRLGKFAPGDSANFDIKLTVDLDMPNDYQNSFAEIQWVFVAQQIANPGPGPTPIPDDETPLLNKTDHFAYIVGYPDGNVYPEGNITRAEVATIFFRLLTDDTRDGKLTTQNSFADVNDGDWYCRAVSTLASLGIVDGYPDGKFYPNAYITRAEFATIAARFDEEADDTSFGFTDVDGHWAEVAINEAANNGWVEGYEDGTFLPNKDITRAEAVTLINRVLHRLPETPDDLLKVMLVWPDNMDTSAWYYLAMQEATNSHNYDYKTDNIHETWTELREARDWTTYEK